MKRIWRFWALMSLAGAAVLFGSIGISLAITGDMPSVRIAGVGLLLIFAGAIGVIATVILGIDR